MGIRARATVVVPAIMLFAFGCGSWHETKPNPMPDAGVCSGPQAVQNMDPALTFGSGSITAPDLSALVCAVSVRLVPDGNGGFVCRFGWDGQPLADFQTPSATKLGLFQANIGVSAAAPGSYSSSDGACGTVTFDYSIPVVPGADCAGATVPCPAGCAPSCSDGGCDGCVQFQAHQSFEASGTSNCTVATARQPAGSWSLNLASVTPAGQGYALHGSLFAVLSHQQGSDSASLAVAF